MFTSYRIATVWGIPILLNWSLLITLFYFARLLGWSDGLLVGIGFFGSIVLHELGHSLVAIRKGCRVRQITLMCVGGAAQMDRVPERPRDETLMALAGPAVSLVLGAALLGLSMWLRPPPMERLPFDLLALLGGLNLTLFGFNLIPAFPMDGGRVLRAALTPRFGRLRATAAAARLGQLLAILLALLGLFHGNWMLVAVMIFVFLLARAEHRHARVEDHIRRMRHGWPFGFGETPEDVDNAPDQGRVRISPPPYARGPHKESEVWTDDERPSVRPW